MVNHDAFSQHNVMGVVSDVPLFNKEKHVQYWMRCLRSPLPTAYSSNDANRMTLAFFLLSALDVLGVLFKRTTEHERRDYVNWIYSCQHAEGGFRSFPPGNSASDHPGKAYEAWCPPNMPATYFALSALAVLGDDMARVRRVECLRWLKKMQDPDGRFGELSTEDGGTAGGKDTRYAYFAASIRWYLRGTRSGAVRSEVQDVPDVDVEKMVENINRSQGYDGGISGVPFEEAHAGFTWCAIATLSLLERVGMGTQAQPAGTGSTPLSTSDRATPFSREAAVEWLAGRLTTTIDDDEMEIMTEEAQDVQDPPCDSDILREVVEEKERSFEKVRSTPVGLRNGVPPLLDLQGVGPLIEKGMFPVHWTGFNGRCNKLADTCYAFWCGASLKMLDGLKYLDVPHVHCYLIERVQNLVAGGFGKLPGDLPDVYHAYLGLAALAIINGRRNDAVTIGPEIEDADPNMTAPNETGLSATRKGDTDRTIRELDPALCISRSARTWIESLEWRNGPVSATASEASTG